MITTITTNCTTATTKSPVDGAVAGIIVAQAGPGVAGIAAAAGEEIAEAAAEEGASSIGYIMSTKCYVSCRYYLSKKNKVLS